MHQSDARSKTATSSRADGRYLATRVEPESAPYFCSGATVDEMRLNLQRSGERGRYRVFDRQPAARGIDSELIGEFVVDGSGGVHWKALSAV